MTSAVLASSFLSGSLLTLLVPVATFIAILTWGVLAIRRHERHRESVQTGGSSAAVAEAARTDAAGPDAAGATRSAGTG